MATLKAAAQAIEQRTDARRARSKTDPIPLPVFDGQYAAVFGVLPRERIQEFEALDVDATAEELDTAACEFIADACRVIHARLEPGGKFEALEHEDAAGGPVRFDAGFAEALGLELEEQSGAAVVRAVWTLEEGEFGDVALHGFGSRLLDWMTDTTRSVEGEVTGG